MEKKFADDSRVLKLIHFWFIVEPVDLSGMMGKKVACFH
jgi:hypothetical protein